MVSGISISSALGVSSPLWYFAVSSHRSKAKWLIFTVDLFFFKWTELGKQSSIGTMPIALKTAFLYSSVAVYGPFIFKNSAIAYLRFGDNEMFVVCVPQNVFWYHWEYFQLMFVHWLHCFFAGALTYVNWLRTYAHIIICVCTYDVNIPITTCLAHAHMKLRLRKLP